MELKRIIYILSIYLIIFKIGILRSQLNNAISNDPYPLYSTYYPYDFLTSRQKANLRKFEYAYAQEKIRISISPFRQYTNRARNENQSVIQIGDMLGRWNMLALFYDPVLRDKLFQALDLYPFFPFLTNPNPSSTLPPLPSLTNSYECYEKIIEPSKMDINKEFGFFSVPVIYSKYGVRVESQLLLKDECFYAVGLMVQTGIANIRQTVVAFNDLTAQAAGTTYPYTSTGQSSGTSPIPSPASQTGITPPYISTTSTTADSITCPQVVPASECAGVIQPFTPITSGVYSIGFGGGCKELVIQRIMEKHQKIADILGLDIRSYQKIGLEDLRLQLFWRQIFIVNQEDEDYPRLLVMPWLAAGAGIPMDKPIPDNQPFAVPLSNNGHISYGASGGLTIDFLDSIDIDFNFGITGFSRNKYINFRMPTSVFEGGIFPYSADVTIKPGITWNLGFGIHSDRFLDNLSFWAEYVIVNHESNDIDICKSFIPSDSIYYKTGFLIKRMESLTKWEVQVFNIALNYDLSENLTAGILWQSPVRQRNAYQSGMILASVNFIY